MSPDKQFRIAAKNVISRLLQMKQHWDDAANSYFEPRRFQTALQSCITVARTVTFVLQSNKSNIPEFDEWYPKFQAAWAADPIMRWAKDARNQIEKQGDLATLSQVKGTIIASYFDGPTTTWMPQAIFATPQAIYRAVPARFLIPHVTDNGTLLVERRWVVTTLPDTEVLEALAHVFEELSKPVADLLTRHELPVPGWLTNRPHSMMPLAMDRAIYLSMKDGSPRGYRMFPRTIHRPAEDQIRKLERRYGMSARWDGIQDAHTIQEIARIYFKHARALMKRDGYHTPFVWFFKGNIPIRLIQPEHPDRASRYVLMRDLAKLALVDGADGMMMIGEAWIASRENLPASGFAVDAPDRGEAIIMHAANSKGEFISLQAIVARRRWNSKKVKAIGPTDADEEGFPFILSPFFREWNCLDEEKLAVALKLVDDLGIETPTIPASDPAGA